LWSSVRGRPPSTTLVVAPTPPTLAPEIRTIAASQVSLLVRLRRNHLVSNSLYLILNSGLQAGAGFIFWIISTHLFSVTNVGLATSLVAAEGVIAFAALLGLNSTMVRYLPGAKDRSVLITSALALVVSTAVIFSSLYVLIIPLVAPRLAFVTHKPILALGFVLLTSVGALNLLTDSIFIGLRQARYNALVDGGIGGVTKIVAAVVVAGAGAYGLFFAVSIGYSVAAFASLILIAMDDHFRPSIRGFSQVLKPLLRFSGANYVGNVLTLLPTFIVPLVVLDRIGVHATAYYYIAYQVVSLLYAAVFAVEQTFLAEGSHDDVDLRKIMRRSWRLLALFCVPASLLLALSAHWLLLVFGRSYSANGTLILIILAASALPLAAFNWLLTVLRLTGQLGAIMTATVVFAALTCGLAWILAPRGLSTLVLAWPLGLTVATCIAAVPFWRWSRRHAAPPPLDSVP
jgi:O-antigen/teichoic acid export membrane protein